MIQKDNLKPLILQDSGVCVCVFTFRSERPQHNNFCHVFILSKNTLQQMLISRIVLCFV